MLFILSDVNLLLIILFWYKLIVFEGYVFVGVVI